jgi:hypothetical protein
MYQPMHNSNYRAHNELECTVQTDMRARIQLTSVGLAQARPN